MDVKIAYKSQKPKKKRKWLRWVLEILFVIVVLMSIRAYQQSDMITGAAPAIMHKDTSGKTVTLSDFRGKPVLLHFWSTTCPICELEESWISSINEDWPVLTVALPTQTEDAIRRYIKNHNIEQWQTIIDTDSSLSENYGVFATPSTFVIDSKGNIRFTEVGITTAWGWRLRLWFTDLVDD